MEIYRPLSRLHTRSIILHPFILIDIKLRSSWVFSTWEVFVLSMFDIDQEAVYIMDA